jgi:hypothetical protein
MSLTRVNDIKKLNPVPAQRTGVYTAANGESRFFKAGDQITRNYTYSHQKGEKPAAAEKKG